MAEKLTFRDSALRAVAIIGLIAILVLGAWGIIQLVFGLPDFFSNWGMQPSPASTVPSESISVQAPSSVTSNQPFSLSWSHQGGSGNYSFAISYACQSGLSLAAPTPTGQYSQVPCNTPFNYTNATGSVQLIAVLSGSSPKTTSLVVSATRLADNTVTAVGSTTIAVAPAQAASQPSGAASPASAYTPSGRTSNLYGSPDLAVQILSATPVGGRYSVQFEISNVGTNVTPYGWEFTAQLPLNPPYTYVSQEQQKLYPGDKIVYTLGFTMPQNYTYQNSYPYYNSYSNAFSVTADPQGLSGDYDRANNTASAVLSY